MKNVTMTIEDVMISSILYNVVDMRLGDWWCVESAMLITFVILHIKLRSSSSNLVLSDDYYMVSEVKHEKQIPQNSEVLELVQTA